MGALEVLAMRARYWTQIENLTGQRFGRWLVLRIAPSKITPSGQPRTMWLCRCDCGLEKPVGAATLVTGTSSGCLDCYRKDPERGLEASRRLRDGRTIAGIARATGLKLTTVDRRWRRGWPVWALGLAPGAAPKKLGGHADVRGKRVSC
jgi:hypothetical protein